MTGRNARMVERIEATPVAYPFRFVVAGDSGAWADPTADGIYSQLVRQVAELDPPPLFFANLGDFAGPGTIERHEHYLGLVEPLEIPNLCVIGNHDLDDPSGRESWDRVHGPVSFEFGYGHTRFVALHAPMLDEREGPRADDLAFLDRALRAADEPNRIVLMHMPPYMDGHYAPHEQWGFRVREREFHDLLHEHGVKLVCCAHGLAFDRHVHEGVEFVMSGGGGTGLCSHFRGVCTEGPGHPEDRGALFHAVEVTVAEDGGTSLRVIQAFAT